jgi:hypothetical protein
MLFFILKLKIMNVIDNFLTILWFKVNFLYAKICLFLIFIKQLNNFNRNYKILFDIIYIVYGK